MKKFLLLVGAVVLTGCAALPAVTVDISESQVKVLQKITTTDADVQRESVKSCGIYNKRPVYVSTYTRDYSAIHIFACK
jgi:hypothetical protein